LSFEEKGLFFPGYGSAAQNSLASLRYDLRKLRAKGLVEKLPKSCRYRLCPQGYSICLVFLKLFERVTRRSPPACFNLIGLTPNSRTTSELNKNRFPEG
jgi:hypothetical protein